MDLLTAVDQRGRTERSAVGAAQRERVDRVPGDADFGIRRFTKVRVILVASGQRQHERTHARDLLSAADDRDIKLGEHRQVVALVADVLHCLRAACEHVVGGEDLMELVLVTLDAHRQSHIARWQLERRTVGLQRIAAGLAGGIGVAIGDDQIDQGGIVRDVERAVAERIESRGGIAAGECGGEGRAVGNGTATLEAVIAAEVRKALDAPVGAEIDTCADGVLIGLFPAGELRVGIFLEEAILDVDERGRPERGGSHEPGVRVGYTQLAGRRGHVLVEIAI